MKLYRIFIPLKYNDKREIEEEIIEEITDMIEKKFSDLSLHPSARPPSIQGIWIDKETKERYPDENSMIELFVEDTFDNQKWFKEFKKKLQKKLNQEIIFIIVQNAEIII